jgi:hypothetical protein
VSTPVSLVLLRGLLPDLPLHPGAQVTARVLEREGARGTILLAGARLIAQLPEGVAQGDVLRLRVQEASGDRLVLRVAELASGATQQAQAQGQAVAPQGLPLALPGGATARLLVDPEGDDPGPGARRAAGARRVTLRYDSPRLGRVDVSITLGADAVAATVHAAAGDPVRSARDAAAGLREALGGAVGRSASVAVRARGETVDLRA